MPLKKIAEHRLKRPPTDIAAANDKLYISTKGRRVYFLSEDESKLGSILFASQVNAVAASGSVLYCGCEDGRIFGLSQAHKVVFRANSDLGGVTGCRFDAVRDELLVGTYDKKIHVFATNSLLRNTLYCAETPVADFDVSPNGTVASVSENNQKIKLVIANVKEPKAIVLTNGFSEALRFISNDSLLVGCLNGMLSLFRCRTLEQVSSLQTGAGIISMYVHKHNLILLGLDNSTLRCIRVNGHALEHIETVELPGLPVAFSPYKDLIAIAVSREHRRGKWGMNKCGKNMLVLMGIV